MVYRYLDDKYEVQKAKVTQLFIMFTFLFKEYIIITNKWNFEAKVIIKAGELLVFL